MNHHQLFIPCDHKANLFDLLDALTKAIEDFPAAYWQPCAPGTIIGHPRGGNGVVFDVLAPALNHTQGAEVLRVLLQRAAAAGTLEPFGVKRTTQIRPVRPASGTPDSGVPGAPLGGHVDHDDAHFVP